MGIESWSEVNSWDQFNSTTEFNSIDIYSINRCYIGYKDKKGMDLTIRWFTVGYRSSTHKRLGNYNTRIIRFL